MSYAGKYKPNRVTLYTDASWKDSYGSWAFWARSDHGRLPESGILPKDIDGIFEGETYAICQGMFRSLLLWPETKGFYIYSDSRQAISFLRHEHHVGRYEPSPVASRLKDAFFKMKKEKDLEIVIRHVKGHKNPNRSTRNWLNNWCDKSAGNARRQYEQSVPPGLRPAPKLQ